MSESRFSALRAPLLGASSLAATAALVALGAGTAHAQTVYLVGAVLYSSSSNGTDTTPQNYQYDTDTNSGASTLEIVYNGTTYDKGIAIPLTAGANTFTFNSGSTPDPGAYGGLGLFFSTSATQYNPSGSSRTPDLSFATATASPASANFTPASGTNVASYFYTGTPAGTSSANGFTSIVRGSKTVTVSNFLFNHDSTGSFAVNIGSAAAPEPGSLALLGVCLTPLAGLIARRRVSRDVPSTS